MNYNVINSLIEDLNKQTLSKDVLLYKKFLISLKNKDENKLKKIIEQTNFKRDYVDIYNLFQQINTSGKEKKKKSKLKKKGRGKYPQKYTYIKGKG